MTPAFWAKTVGDDQPGISVHDHMVNVGLVALCLAHVGEELLRHFEIELPQVGALAALHDLGKISPGFQRKCAAWLKANHLSDIARRCAWDRDMESDHGQVTHAAVQTFLVEQGANRRAAKYLSAILGGHHGRLHWPSDRGFQPTKAISEQHSGIDWAKARNDAALAICDTFHADLARFTIDADSPALWWLAGLTSVADWIGSDERFFSPEHGTAATDTAENAKKAIQTIGLVPPKIKTGLSFHDLFHDPQVPSVPFTPNDMQLRAMSTITTPGVYVVEGPMGTGKTEAALGAAYNLLVENKASGVYFALPTQATSNRMHLRMAEFVRRIAPDIAASRLIHGNSWLMDHEVGVAPAASGTTVQTEDARVGRDWFASAKRALLAPFGVGTVDQALLAVVAAKHFFVRRYALAGKVVILDEVHSYDLYTGTLIDKLILTLEQLQCTVIVLSATLTGKRRHQVVGHATGTVPEADLSYPLITGRRAGEAFAPVSVAPPPERDVEVVFQASDEAARHATALAEAGGCVLWICNTVASAQNRYQQFLATAGRSFPLGLLHSRFPFWRREELENEWMERFGKTGSGRRGSILVSTQIVEQSVDLDADLLVTELAPTDMLLQRIGRLWRHDRGHRPSSAARVIILEEAASFAELRHMGKAAILNTLGSKAYVYDPYVLLRSLETWKDQRHIVLPTQIRSLIDATYEERDDEPETWLELLCEGFGKATAYKQRALQSSNIWTVALEDDEGVQTRLNEVPTLSLVLCRNISKSEAAFLDDTRADFRGDAFRLAAAQAIHRNVVRVPARSFRQTAEHPGIARYLRGNQCVGLVEADGTIKAEGWEGDGLLHWSADLGIVMGNTCAKEQI